MKRIGKVIIWAAAAALAAVLSMSVYQVYLLLQERNAAEAVYEDLDRFIQIPGGEAAGEQVQTAGQDRETGQGAVSGQAGQDIRPEVDFDSLEAVNGQVVGWIYGEGTGISYPIAQASDNDYYLKRMFNGEWNPNGCIFLDYRNRSDFADSHSIIYGHHMKSGAMFAGLSKYKSQEFYEGHPEMLLLTPEGDYVVEIFAGYVADVDGEAWDMGFGSDEDYEAWLARSIDRSGISTGIVPEASDRILTLSTCSYEFDDARFVLLGILRAVEMTE